MSIRIHPTADVSPEAQIGEGTSIWQQAQLQPHPRLGRHCIVGKGVYVDFDVEIGDNVKIQNYVSIYHGVQIEDSVFVEHVCFTNNNLPRAANPNGVLKGIEDWVAQHILVRRGASLGANATVLPRVEIGEWALVGAGGVVTKDVPAHGLVVGNPARMVGFVCACGGRLEAGAEKGDLMPAHCARCGERISIPLEIWSQVQ